ncbi:MAG: hypothetical protein DBY30_04990 [Verrucomicrobia bacterium]|nr:MAG: hypothetical protein DBY30_04990 [Verrucomicrobiota bacterium]
MRPPLGFADFAGCHRRREAEWPAFAEGRRARYSAGLEERRFFRVFPPRAEYCGGKQPRISAPPLPRIV